jgi:hypothetical protein
MSFAVLESTFLEALAQTGNVSAAAKAAGVGRQYAYERRAADPELAAAWDEALDVATDALEREARRRALEGCERPVFYKGDECGRIREYSDTLMIFLLKAHRPQKFRDNVDINHSGDLDIKVTPVVFLPIKDLHNEADGRPAPQGTADSIPGIDG